ncbi:hypothetical protein ACIA5G_51365 [Amycolatopsis sp. NPDC051758]|uniref:hypothetical protein n=1 Tax=Amycolatopsis sp. NPDC051758 TaxID=3363935 RepID=UPI0037A60536
MPENLQSQEKRPHRDIISRRLAHLDGVVLTAGLIAIKLTRLDAHLSGKALA